MNKKTFTLALTFFCVTVVWLGVNIYWVVARPARVCMLDLLIAFLFVLAGAGMTWNEYKKKRRRHLDEVNPHKLP
ncbi:hypothetical protein [uncultured Alistipes sp.]|uniref:hypothetical protein n=1 Tax=uncultured Alistipes sp. TaxID=538949 RepID=UPI001F90A9F6|nr:hypothetical protein [uncultured Alistipes sp.]HJC17795.1 hypothetical protein [Candidatus Alistipes stercorigallinarum]